MMPRSVSVHKVAVTLFPLVCVWIVVGGKTMGSAQETDESGQSDIVSQGQYVFALAGGCGCHTAADGQVNAGGRRLATPYGTFYGTNITPDKTYGIGSWTDQEIIDAIRLGVRPDGSVMSPVMPYPALSGMSDEDATALVAFLRSLPPVPHKNRAHELSIPMAGMVMRLWRWFFFEPIEAPPRAPHSGLERGRYISTHLAHCQECHSPRTVFGTLDQTRYLAGNPDGIDGEIAPNITPEPQTGVGEWNRDEIVSLLRTGFLPNFDNVQGLMALVIEGVPEGGYKDMSDADARAVADYLKTVPAVVHEVPQ